MSPEDWKSAGEALTYLLLGAGSLFTAQKVKSQISGSSPSEHDETGSATLSAVERVEAKLDRMAGSFRVVKVEVEGLADDVQRQGQDINRLSSGFREVAVRVDALESRMQRPM